MSSLLSRLILVLACLVVLAGCGDPVSSVRLRNDSTDDLYVWTREASGGYSPIFRIDHGRHGAALSVPGKWVGVAIVLNLSCGLIAVVNIDGNLPTVAIDAKRSVEVVYGEVPYTSPGTSETILEPIGACGVSYDG